MKEGGFINKDIIKEEQIFLGDQYRVVGLLGTGGSSRVYLVCHIPTEQLRAAKLLINGVSGNLQQELTLLKRLKHASLPELYDVIEVGEYLWLIMEYIRGQRLDEIRDQEKNRQQFYMIAEQLTQVVCYLHTRTPPILHLDIKPSNIILCPNNRVVLIDFGASIVRSNWKNTGEIRGTRGFAAPEQYHRGGILDARTDIYGVGATLFFYLHGTIWHGQAKQKKYNDIWQQEADRILEKCLAKKMENRFQDAKQLHEQFHAGSVSLEHRKTPKPRGGLIGAFCLVILILAGGNLRIQSESTGGGDYIALLEKAKLCGLPQAEEYYREAAVRQPLDSRWCSSLINRITEDFTYSLEEEELLKRILYQSCGPEKEKTILEIWQEQSCEYGELAYQIGMAYWYYYYGSGGKSAAASWFQLALQAGEQQKVKQNKTPVWYSSALIHEKISGYYFSMNQPGGDANDISFAQEYWKDLKSLLQLESWEYEPEMIRGQILKELLSTAILYGSGFVQNGMTQEEITGSLEVIKLEIEKLESDANWKNEMVRQWEAAFHAVMRGVLENNRLGGIVD